MAEDKPPTRKIGTRRVRTEPVAGQSAEPPPDWEENASNDERLKAEKPPHY